MHSHRSGHYSNGLWPSNHERQPLHYIKLLKRLGIFDFFIHHCSGTGNWFIGTKPTNITTIIQPKALHPRNQPLPPRRHITPLLPLSLRNPSTCLIFNNFILQTRLSLLSQRLDTSSCIDISTRLFGLLPNSTQSTRIFPFEVPIRGLHTSV
ncbi:hypothetical protein BT63DRAFT_428152 [Microthyrium microscopicum]|uniref:Uncharacterized protein n=1 Tax=Microthyrium microscopicum TaxID=703497 RepID=A0A6A6U518_9PEZI|nr:hypothetical protein BT63DRAFT_428152 [Microthyrium microscopicum]